MLGARTVRVDPPGVKGITRAFPHPFTDMTRVRRSMSAGRSSPP